MIKCDVILGRPILASLIILLESDDQFNLLGTYVTYIINSHIVGYVIIINIFEIFLAWLTYLPN